MFDMQLMLRDMAEVHWDHGLASLLSIFLVLQYL